MTDLQTVKLRVVAADGVYGLSFELDLDDENAQAVLSTWEHHGARLEKSPWTGKMTVEMGTDIAERWLRYVTRYERQLWRFEVLRALRWLMAELWETHNLGPSRHPVSGVVTRFFATLALPLPMNDRMRYREEWRSEWVDLRPYRLRIRLGYLYGLLRSTPSLVIVMRWPKREAA